MRSRRLQGEGSIYQRADGRWTGTIEAGREGGRKHRQVYGRTKREVADKLIEDATGGHAGRDLRLAAGNLWRDHDLVFSGPVGQPLDHRGDHREWERILRAAGVRDVPLHVARHTSATLLLV